MGFRKTFCLLAALIMTFGASDLLAQEAVPRGVRVRLVSPDSASWAGIGKKIQVDVLRTKNLSPILNQVIVVLRGDSLVPRNTSSLTTSSFSADSLGLLGTGTGADRFVDTLTAANVTGAAVDTFRFTFTVTVGDPELTKVFVQTFLVDANSTPAVSKLNNLNTTPMSTVPGFTNPVGDKNFVKIDGLRPVNGTIFDSVLVDTSATTANFPGTTNRSFKIGSQIKMKMHVKNFNAASAQIGIYEIGNTHPDSAMYSKSFTAAQVVSAVNGVRDSLTVAAGQFTIEGGTKKNNLRTKVLAFLVDNAGNLSANTATAATAQGFSQAITYVIDSQAPKITLTFPDSTGKRFTGRKDTSITYRKDNGTVSATTFTMNPLKFGVDEGTTIRWAIVGKDTASFGGTSSTSSTTFTTTDLFSASKGKKGGKAVDLTIVASDSVGNKITKTQAAVIHDQVAATVSSLFPASASLPEDKINNITRHPVFQIDEVADTISVRYIQAGTSPPDVVTQSVSASKLSTVGADISVTVNDSLITGTNYSLQVFIRDLAGNVSFTANDTLTFDKNFSNPSADSFLIAVDEDSVLAGQSMMLTVTAIDSMLTRKAGSTRKAVTYNKTGVLLSAGAATSITYWGTGVKDNGDGTANLDGLGWIIGERTVWLKSNVAIDNFTISSEDTSTTIVDGTATKVVNFHGSKAKLTVDSADLRKYVVKALQGGEGVTEVEGAFDVTVLPTDWWGNPSMKKPPATLTRGDSLKLLDTRLASPVANSVGLLEEILVEFSANMGAARVPSGAQGVGAEGATFSVIAPNTNGEGLLISVRTVGGSGDSSGVATHLQAVGHVTLAFRARGAAPGAGGGNAPAAPANLVVEDYLGAGGGGDQGFYVMVSFPNSGDHGRVGTYRLHRELNVTTALDAAGNVVLIDPAPQWVPWARIDAVPANGGISRAVIPVTDNLATGWAVTAEGIGGASGATVAGKRVFTKESVQMMAQFFGVDPNRIVSPEDLGQMFVPSADYIKSIIGDQENVVFAALDPDVSRILGVSSVPQNIRTQAGKISSSARTLAEHAVAAVDNIAPAAVAEASVTGETVSWLVSADDGTVGYINYRGFAIPIAGVTQYDILGGASADGDFASIATVPAGSHSFTVDPEAEYAVEDPAWLRIDALDLDNRAIGAAFEVAGGILGRVQFVDADGVPVFIMVIDGHLTVGFPDFITFAGAFGTATGDPKFNLQADTDDSGDVGFADFINFAGSFGKTAVGPATKPVILPPGVNENAEFSLRLGSERVLAGEIVSVDVSLANVQSLVGYGFVLNYEADKFEFVEATAADQDLLKSTGGETPLFFQQSEKAGQVSIANAVVNGSEVSGGGDIVRLSFRVLQEFEQNARFEVAEGLVFDPQQLSNPAVVAGVLNIKSTPTEFALLQNFPNPFNPETTIAYNLAESADVTLQIYNVVGQVVRTLVAEPQSAGRYEMRWNGRDDRGVPVSSGIYFYQVSAGKFQDVRKLMLLK